jgi:hypothetical protein
MRGKQEWNVDITMVNYNYNEQDKMKPTLIRGQAFRLIRLANEVSLIKLSGDYQIIDREAGEVIHNPVKLISSTHLARLERQDEKMNTALVSMLSNFLGRNLHEVEVFRAELDRAIDLFNERPLLLKKRERIKEAEAKKRAKNRGK